MCFEAFSGSWTANCLHFRFGKVRSSVSQNPVVSSIMRKYVCKN